MSQSGSLNNRQADDEDNLSVNDMHDEAPDARERQPVYGVRAINVKTPTFCRVNPALWFVQMEAHFEMNRVTADKTKYNAIVASIDGSILQQVSDLVLHPPANDRYLALKTRILERFADSDESRLKKLLTGVSLGDKKPSHLLRDMKELAGTGLSTAALKSLWLQRLPTQCQAILSISTAEDLDKLSAMADKICDISISEICTISSSSSNASNSKHNSNDSVNSKLDTLIRRMDQFDNQLSQISRSKSPFQKRSSRGRSKSLSNEKKICWYHRKFSDKATKCIQPCEYTTRNSEN